MIRHEKVVIENQKSINTGGGTNPAPPAAIKNHLVQNLDAPLGLTAVRLSPPTVRSDPQNARVSMLQAHKNMCFHSCSCDPRLETLCFNGGFEPFVRVLSYFIVQFGGRLTMQASPRPPGSVQARVASRPRWHPSPGLLIMSFP